MEVVFSAWGYSFKLVFGVGNPVLLVGSIIVTHLLDRWFPGKRARTDLDNLKKSNAALEVRLSIMERTRESENQPPPDQPTTPSNEAGPPQRDEEIWLRSPGAGRIAAQLMMTAPTFEDVERIFDGFRASPHKDHTGWANWAYLFRLEKTGGRKRYTSERLIFGTKADFWRMRKRSAH